MKTRFNGHYPTHESDRAASNASVVSAKTEDHSMQNSQSDYAVFNVSVVVSAKAGGHTMQNIKVTTQYSMCLLWSVQKQEVTLCKTSK